LITPPSSSQSPTTLLALRRAQRSVSMLPTTTCSALCQVWEDSHTPTKRVNTQCLA
jgi:hypothetical protein